MNSLVLLAIGMAIVLGSILVLRLHAFLALILAAMIVAALTPQATVRDSALRKSAIPVRSIGNAGTVTLDAGGKKKLIAGMRLLVVRPDVAAGDNSQVATIEVREIRVGDDGEPVSAVADVVALHGVRAPRAGDLVVPPSALAAAQAIAKQTFGHRVAVGFGQTCQGIGILIAMAAVIGKCLLDSGAAERIVAAARALFGDRRTSLAFVLSGFVVGIPVFFDTVFYLLMPLGKAMRMRTGRNYTLYVLSIVIGATMAHSLIPPTPGPLLVADALDVPIGLMMLGGGVVGLFTVSAGYLYAVWANRRWDIPLRPTAELTAEELDELATAEARELPPLWLSLAPILLPVLLIAGKTVLDMVFHGVATADLPAWVARCRPVLNALGDKNVALVIAAAVALGMLARTRQANRESLSAGVRTALAGGGVIILITAAGGAFGKVLQQTGIAADLGHMVPSAQVGLLLPLAFGVTMIVRGAQGSATVAMITAVGIVAPLAGRGDLPFDPLYLALAIGCGSKPLSWMNDSGFWIVGKMSGMTEGETLKTFSAALTVMGLVGLAVVCLGAWLIPLV